MQGRAEASSNGSVVPEWSGTFWVTDECMGIMTIHVSDRRPHRPPLGWVLHDDYIDHGEQGEGECAVLIYTYDWEVFLRDNPL